MKHNVRFYDKNNYLIYYYYYVTDIIAHNSPS